MNYIPFLHYTNECLGGTRWVTLQDRETERLHKTDGQIIYNRIKSAVQ